MKDLSRLPESIIKEYLPKFKDESFFGHKLELLDRDSLLAMIGYLLDIISEKRL